MTIAMAADDLLPCYCHGDDLVPYCPQHTPLPAPNRDAAREHLSPLRVTDPTPQRVTTPPEVLFGARCGELPARIDKEAEMPTEQTTVETQVEQVKQWVEEHARWTVRGTGFPPAFPLQPTDASNLILHLYGNRGEDSGDGGGSSLLKRAHALLTAGEGVAEPDWFDQAAELAAEIEEAGGA